MAEIHTSLQRLAFSKRHPGLKPHDRFLISVQADHGAFDEWPAKCRRRPVADSELQPSALNFVIEIWERKV
jgi:hypothetical protein